MMRAMSAENRVLAPLAEDSGRLSGGDATTFEAPESLQFVERIAAIGLWNWSVPARAMTWSAGVFALLDLRADATAPSFERLLGMMHPDDRLRNADLESVIARGLPVDRRFRVILGNGSLRTFELKGEVRFDAGGRPVRAMGLLRDVTSGHEAFRIVQFMSDRYTALRRLVDDLVLVACAEGMVIDGAQWRQQTGQDAARTVSWLDAVHPDDRERVSDVWRQANIMRAPFTATFRLSYAEGGSRAVIARCEPIATRNGAVREWLIVISAEGRAVSDAVDTAETLSLTGAQIRAARAILNWSVRDLSEAADVSISTIRRMEEFDGALAAMKGKLGQVRATLETAGAEFIFPPHGKPGVRPR
jgi:PAS domain-containing protein